MRPAIDPVAPATDRPDSADVVVIGGGIIGTCTALALAERGCRVVLCEKGVIAGEQSGRNWGWVRRMGRDVAEYPLGLLSLDLWAGLNARIGAETGFRRAGILYAAETAAEMRTIAQYKREADAFGVAARLLTGADCAALMPGLSRPVLGAIHTADDGRAEPALAAPAIARAVRRLGGHVLTGCAVRGIETAAGRVHGVVTEHGPIRAAAVVLAGGAWSRLFAGNLGLGLPILKVKSSVLRTGPVAGGPEITLGNGHFGLRRRLDGGYTLAPRGTSQAQITPDAFRLLGPFLPALVRQRHELTLQLGRSFIDDLRTPRRWTLDAPSPFEAVRILDPAPSARQLAAARAALIARFPAFAAMQEVERWAGMIDTTPDAIPIIDAAPIPGLVIATGFSGHGFGIGPGAGMLAADLVTGAPPCVDPHPFRLSRFAGGRGAPRHPAGLRQAA